MFKFNKSTHLTIISTFAIVFIVIYLYFTITDLRKLQNEVSKLSKQVQTLQEQQSMVTSCSVPVPEPTLTFNPVVNGAMNNIPVMTPVKIEVEEDASSVGTDEIKNLLDQEESEENVEKPETPLDVPEEPHQNTEVLSSSTTQDMPKQIKTRKSKK